MNITITIPTETASDRLQAMGKALNTNGTDQDQKRHVTDSVQEHLRNLYRSGSRMLREEAEELDAKTKADDITVS